MNASHYSVMKNGRMSPHRHLHECIKEIVEKYGSCHLSSGGFQPCKSNKGYDSIACHNDGGSWIATILRKR